MTIVLILLGLGGVVHFGGQAWSGKPPLVIESSLALPAPSVEAGEDRPAELEPSRPTRLRISSIGVDAPVDMVGLADDSTLETPPLGAHTTGWYELSPTPGEVGPAIIVGHVDSLQGPSVFYRLGEVQPGATITIARADGTEVNFTITEVKQFDQANFPTEDVYGDIDHAGLRLITCGGTFNYATQRYSHNTVVYASIAF